MFGSLCGSLSEFLTDPVHQTWDRPLKEESSGHVHQWIGVQELPLQQQTLRAGDRTISTGGVDDPVRTRGTGTTSEDR
jgi:hypothetical protein